MTTETKQDGRLVRVKAFASRTMKHRYLEGAKRGITKSAIVVNDAVKGGADVVWRRVIKPILAFLRKWIGPMARGLVQGYVVLCISVVTSLLMQPVSIGRYAGWPLLVVLLRTGFRTDIAVR